MTFITEWQAKLENSYTNFAQLAATQPNFNFTYLLGLAVLWPVVQPVKQYNVAAIQAVQQILPDSSSAVLATIPTLPEGQAEAVQSLAALACDDATLEQALIKLIDYFDATSTFIRLLAQQNGRTIDTGQINISDISGGEISVGNIISGIVHGDVVSGDKIINITNIIGGPVEQPKPDVPPLPYEPETVLIPAGPFLMGSDQGEADESPQHEVDLAAYRIGIYPITNRQYAEFIKQNKRYAPPTNPRWFLREPPAGKLDHPVTGVSWRDAMAYCTWLTEQTQGTRCYRLPTEAEWEKAARGADGRRYPWGNTWVDGTCNCGSNNTTAVIHRDENGEAQPSYPQGVSVYGCYDMAGNVQEWVSTLWGSDLKVNAFPYPYRADDGRENSDADRRFHRVYRLYRGGSFRDEADKLGCSARGTSSADSTIRWRGFRVVMEL